MSQAVGSNHQTARILWLLSSFGLLILARLCASATLDLRDGITKLKQFGFSFLSFLFSLELASDGQEETKISSVVGSGCGSYVCGVKLPAPGPSDGCEITVTTRLFTRAGPRSFRQNGVRNKFNKNGGKRWAEGQQVIDF